MNDTSKLTRLEIATIKRTNTTIQGYLKKRDNLINKLEKISLDINTQIKEIEDMIDMLNKPILEITQGMTAQEYCTKSELRPENENITINSSESTNL